MSDTTKSLQRFKTNPVEFVIFLIMTGIFFHSVYHLFYDTPDFTATTLSPMEANPLSENRRPATHSTEFLNLAVTCDSKNLPQTLATKVRIKGPLCKMNLEEPTQTNIKNVTNKFSATVFIDPASKEFSTDYISLNSGTNHIQMDFYYPNGKTLTQNLFIEKP